jgi:hypothetical protein
MEIDIGVETDKKNLSGVYEIEGVLYHLSFS